MAQQEWFIDVQGAPYGPYTAAQLREFAANGQLFPTTNVMLGSHGKWMPALRVAGLFPATVPAPPIVAAPMVAPAVVATSTPHFTTSTSSGIKTLSGDVIGTPVLACGLIGAGTLIAGVFMPLLQVPIFGSINYFTIEKVDSSIIIGLGIVSAIAVLLKVTWPCVVGGLVTLGFITYRFTNLSVGMAHAKEELKSQAGDNPFAGLASTMADSVGIQWGFAVLAIGAMTLIVAPMLREFRKKSERSTTIGMGFCLALLVVLGVGGITYMTHDARNSKPVASSSVEETPSKPERASPKSVLATLTGKDSTASKPKTEENPNPTTIGETIRLGNLKITPVSAAKRSIVVSPAFGLRDQRMEREGPFVVITAEVQNLSEGQVFNPFAYATGVDNFGNDLKNLDNSVIVREPEEWFGDLQPGEKGTITLILEPPNPKAKWFQIQVSQTVDNQKKKEKWSLRLNNE